MIAVAINGYGRIGRIAHRILVDKYKDSIDVVAINAGSSTDLTGWMYLLKYDSVYGFFDHDLSAKPDTTKPEFLGHIIVDGKDVAVYSQKDPTLLPWKEHEVDVVLECTGKFTKKEKLDPHLTTGAKKVILSAPAKGADIPTYVLSVNSEQYKNEAIVSNASCTTNCIAPVAKIIDKHFGIEKAMMTTVHGYTSDQRLHDGGHKDYRRARAAAVNIVPTSTGATTAAAKTLPQLADRFGGLALRVPVPTGSLSDFTFLLKKNTTVQEINTVLTEEAGSSEYKGIVAVTTDPIVSSDIVGNPHSAIVDLSLTQVVGENMAKVIAWYDNEFGYANRLVEAILLLTKE